jgi:hypothetical protein
VSKNQPTFNERLQTAAAAKQAQLAKALAKAPANDPRFADQQAERIAISKARDQRQAEAAARKRAEVARKAEEKAAAAIAAQEAAEAKKAAEHAALNQKALDALALKAAQKAGRDAKYAARKARRDGRGK